jgi:two-component system, chemotaxis family, CheB/CheR fusion protein
MTESGFPEQADTEGFAGLIVALGASAGGLDALDRFFSTVMPTGSCAFVVIQHLAPEHKTMMDTLLGRHTRMPVQVAEDNMPLEGGHVYVIPPNATMTVETGRLRLLPRASTGVALPINTFFESLARDAPGRAIGIILSGTGSDGSAGVESLARAGAWVMAQEPDTCRFDGMPRNAIATGAVDHVLSPEELAAEVTTIVTGGLQAGPRALAEARSLAGAGTLETALRLLAATMRIDFSEYKPNTLLRRVERRMNATGFRSLEAYADYASGHPDEIVALRHELLIPVTSFFRDADAFRSLQENVLRPLVEERLSGMDDPIRIWIVACATGEEVYSIAIQVIELMESLKCRAPLKIFATDVEADYVSRAAAGRFPQSQISSLPPEKLARWFTPADDGYWQVQPRLRQQIVFSRHDILTDAPFTQMDLITCRNMLIYLRHEAQQRVLRRLSYGLKAGGCLFLGSSETPGDLSNDYTTLDNRGRIYRLLRRMGRLSADDLLAGRFGGQRALSTGTDRASAGYGVQVDTRDALAALTEAYAPPSVLVDSDRQVLQMFGNAQRFLRFHGAAPTLDILQLLPKLVAPVVATLLHSAAREKTLQRSRSVRFESPDGAGGENGSDVHITVRPLDPGSLRVTRLLVSFEPVARRGKGTGPVLDEEAIARMSTKHAADLERELELTRANLQDAIQELGTANEELQASNEELMASNEELQSTNEELQSVNEELHTVNAEYQSKIVQLNELNADLENLTRAAQIPMIFLDEDLCITRFTPQATALFQLRPGDAGRPITDLNHRLEFDDLHDRLRQGIELSATYQAEVSDLSGGSWLVTILPYSLRGAAGPRVVISFIDVSGVKDLRRLQAILDALPENVAVLDRLGVIRETNRSWSDFCLRNGGSLASSGRGASYLAACRSAAASDPYAKQAYDGITGILERAQPHFSMLYPCDSETESRWFLLTAAALPDGGCVVTHFNMSGWIDPARIRTAGEAPYGD